MKIDGKEVSLYEENGLDNLIKAGLVTTAVTSALFFSPVPMKAAGWKANSPEEIASRIDYDQRSLTFESGDTIWNLGAALNIKNPMDLLTYNHYQPGDEYHLPVGTIIYWDEGHLIIKDPEGTVIGDKMITEQDKQNPEQPIPLEGSQQAPPQKNQGNASISYEVTHPEEGNFQNNGSHSLNEVSKETINNTSSQPSETMQSDTVSADQQVVQAQQRINALLSKKSTIELEIARVTADIVNIEEEIQNRKSMNMQLLDQYMLRDQELNTLQQEINDYITYQLNPKKEQLTHAMKEEAQALKEYERINLTFKTIQDQLQELEVQQQVADIAVQQLNDQVATFPVTDDRVDEFLQKKSDYEYQLTLKAELEDHRAQLMIQFLEYDELLSEQKLVFEGKKALVVLLKQEVEEQEITLDTLKQAYHQVDLGYQQQQIEVQKLDLEPLLQKLQDKRNLLMRLEKKLAIIDQELNDLYTLYRPAGEQPSVDEQEHVLSETTNTLNKPNIDLDLEHEADIFDDQKPLINNQEQDQDQGHFQNQEQNDRPIEDLEHNLAEDPSLDLIQQEQEADKESISENNTAVSILNEQQMMDALDQLFHQNKLTSRQYMEGIRDIQEAKTLTEKKSEFQRIQAIAEANGKKPQQVSKETFMRLLNEYRQKQGLSQLKLDNTLSAAAEVRANEIVQKFDHKRPDGSLFNTVLDGTEPVVAYSENIAIAHAFDNNGVEIAEYLFDAWQTSPLHDKNLRTTNNTRIGFAYVQGPDGLYYAVLLFGTLKS